MAKCISCGKENIENLEISLNKKLINKNISEYLCLDCLSKKFNCNKEKLIKYATECKKAGCVLFKFEE